MKDKNIVVFSFCSKEHKLDTGKPVGHKCFVAPTEALVYEQRGDKEKAKSILERWKSKREHNGLKA